MSFLPSTVSVGVDTISVEESPGAEPLAALVVPEAGGSIGSCLQVTGMIGCDYWKA